MDQVICITPTQLENVDKLFCYSLKAFKRGNKIVYNYLSTRKVKFNTRAWKLYLILEREAATSQTKAQDYSRVEGDGWGWCLKPKEDILDITAETVKF